MVSIGLYDLRGALVCGLLRAAMPPGAHTVRLSDTRGQRLAHGSYICRMQSAGFSKAVQVNLLR
jgi:hypothetical protein